MENDNKKLKKRLWAFVCYPESLPDTWKDDLQKSGLKIAISPLHDKDINADGEPKKAHYHVIIVYDGPTTYKNVLSFTNKLNATVPIPLENVRGYYNYLTHKDNPEKYQYDPRDIVCLNGFSVSDFIELTKSEVLDIENQLLDLINQLGIIEYSDFLDYVRIHCSRDLNEVAHSHTIMFNAYLRSKRHRNQNLPCEKLSPQDKNELSDEAALKINLK